MCLQFSAVILVEVMKKEYTEKDVKCNSRSHTHPDTLFLGLLFLLCLKAGRCFTVCRTSKWEPTTGSGAAVLASPGWGGAGSRAGAWLPLCPHRGGPAGVDVGSPLLCSAPARACYSHTGLARRPCSGLSPLWCVWPQQGLPHSKWGQLAVFLENFKVM